MDEDVRTTSLGMKAAALVVLLIFGWILLKFVIGVVTAVAWIVVLVVALVAVVWALSVLRS